MLFPIIKVHDKLHKNQEIIVGEDERHHILLVEKDGNLKFLNVQCCDGTGKGGSYEFLSRNGYFGDEIEFGTIFDILTLYAKNIQSNESGFEDEYQLILNELSQLYEKAVKAQSQKNENFFNRTSDTYLKKIKNNNQDT